MNRSRFAIVAIAAVTTAAGSVAFAQAQQPAKDSKPAAPKTIAPTPADQQPQLPPGWTEADMQACAVAGMPGEMHTRLAESIGVWSGKSTMWMAPGSDPVYTESTSTITPMMDGRFTKCEWAGDMPGMGPFHGFGLYGFDNVARKFQSIWIDNCGTGIMTGTGELSSDGKAITWTYSYNCPITRKPTVLREIERNTGKDTKAFEMYGIDPKSGKEYKMMEVALTRSLGNAQAAVWSIADRTVEAGCAHCIFAMPGVKGCKLAVNVDGTAYLVSGADQVDAHQFCTAAKKVVVTGRIEGDRFVASEFEILPDRR
jgi:uncharacterized protein DUF1579/uncharacterized protein DUF6370